MASSSYVTSPIESKPNEVCTKSDETRGSKETIKVEDSSAHTPQSSSRSRKHSEEVMEAIKRAKASDTPETISSEESVCDTERTKKFSHELTILGYIDKLLDRHTTIINANIEKKFADTSDQITRLETEMRATCTDLSSRLTIIERNHGKTKTDHEERFLQIENSMAQQNIILKKELKQISQYNDILSARMDTLMQEKLAQNVYVTELLTGAQNKVGFSEFAQSHLKINAYPQDIRKMYSVNRGQETVTKIIFESVEPKNIYYNARRNLRDLRRIWIREDLTKPRVNLSYLGRRGVELGYFHRTWTNQGDIFISFGLETRPIRIQNPLEMDKVAGGRCLYQNLDTLDLPDQRRPPIWKLLPLIIIKEMWPK